MSYIYDAIFVENFTFDNNLETTSMSYFCDHCSKELKFDYGMLNSRFPTVPPNFLERNLALHLMQCGEYKVHSHGLRYKNLDHCKPKKDEN